MLSATGNRNLINRGLHTQGNNLFSYNKKLRGRGHIPGFLNPGISPKMGSWNQSSVLSSSSGDTICMYIPRERGRRAGARGSGNPGPKFQIDPWVGEEGVYWRPIIAARWKSKGTQQPVGRAGLGAGEHRASDVGLGHWLQRCNSEGWNIRATPHDFRAISVPNRSHKTIMGWGLGWENF